MCVNTCWSEKASEMFRRRVAHLLDVVPFIFCIQVYSDHSFPHYCCRAVGAIYDHARPFLKISQADRILEHCTTVLHQRSDKTRAYSNRTLIFTCLLQQAVTRHFNACKVLHLCRAVLAMNECLSVCLSVRLSVYQTREL